MRPVWFFASSSLWLVGCGGSGNAAEAPGQTSPSASAREAPAQIEEPAEAIPASATVTTGIPKECVAGKSPCVPPADWVQRLCADVHADVALYLFQRGTPWQRMYLTRETEAVNASGGASLEGTLAFDEEVLILRHRGGDSAIVVGSGAGSYDALRWNGSCVSLDSEELTQSVPPSAKFSRVEWRWLGDDTQTALRQDPVIDKTYIARKRECKGVTLGAVSKKCEVLDNQLVEAVVKSVRNGLSIPEPENQPK